MCNIYTIHDCVRLYIQLWPVRMQQYLQLTMRHTHMLKKCHASFSSPSLLQHLDKARVEGELGNVAKVANYKLPSTCIRAQSSFSCCSGRSLWRCAAKNKLHSLRSPSQFSFDPLVHLATGTISFSNMLGLKSKLKASTFWLEFKSFMACNRDPSKCKVLVGPVGSCCIVAAFHQGAFDVHWLTCSVWPCMSRPLSSFWVSAVWSRFPFTLQRSMALTVCCFLQNICYHKPPFKEAKGKPIKCWHIGPDKIFRIPQQSYHALEFRA